MSGKEDLFAGPPAQPVEDERKVGASSELDETILRSLAERYRGAVDTRGLWLWAGGRESEIVYDDDPTARWRRLWELAAGESSATQIAVVREMLLDLPGDDALLGYLEGQVHDADPPGAVLGDIIGDLIEAAGAESEPGLLRAVLEALPAHVDDDQTFASLAPALHRRFDAEARATMERILDQLLYPDDDEDGEDTAEDEGSRNSVGSGEAGSGSDESTDSPEEHCTADDLERAVTISIDAFVARFEASGLADDEKKRQRVTSLTQDLRKAVHDSRSGDSGKPQLKMADALGRLEMEAGAEAPELHLLIAAIGHQVHCLVFVETRHPLPEPVEAARVFAWGLWATLPDDGSDSTPAAS